MQVSAGPPTADGAQLYTGAAARCQLLPVGGSRQGAAILARLVMLAHSVVPIVQAWHGPAPRMTQHSKASKPPSEIAWKERMRLPSWRSTGTTSASRMSVSAPPAQPK